VRGEHSWIGQSIVSWLICKWESVGDAQNPGNGGRDEIVGM
jgi:hypothetical protein